MDANCSTPETICLQCGDVGFPNAFVYCVKCLEFAVHRYCLDVIPKFTDEFVQWYCDDCDVRVQKKSAIGKSDAIQCKTRELTSSKNILGNSGVGTKKNDIIPFKIDKPVYEGSMRQSYVSCAKFDLDECAESASAFNPMGFRGMNDKSVILLASDKRKRYKQSSTQRLEEEKVKDNLMCHDELSPDTPLKERMEKKRSAVTVSTVREDKHIFGSNSPERPHEECAINGIGQCAKLASDSTLSREVKESKASQKRDHQCRSQQLCESDPRPGKGVHRILSCNSSLRSPKKKKTNMSSEANLEHQRHRSLSAQHFNERKCSDLRTQCSEERGINVSNDRNKNRESGVSEGRSSASNHESNFCREFSRGPTILSMADCNLCAKPVVTPIWRGSFNIWNKKEDVLEGLMAHLSNRACRKVYDEASQFQPTLHLEMLPKTDVWPKSFQTSEPSGESIALFFFPSEIRSERIFEHLVNEMVDKELALRAIVPNAHLLIFTSTELPLPYWRFEGNYYLWGVFRDKQNPASRSQSCSREPRYNPMMRKDHLDDTDSTGGKTAVTTKSFGGRSPHSPLSNCSSYASRTS